MTWAPECPVSHTLCGPGNTLLILPGGAQSTSCPILVVSVPRAGLGYPCIGGLGAARAPRNSCGHAEWFQDTGTVAGAGQESKGRAPPTGHQVFGWRVEVLEVCLQNPDPGPEGLERGKGRGAFTGASGAGGRAAVRNTTDGASVTDIHL